MSDNVSATGEPGRSGEPVLHRRWPEATAAPDCRLLIEGSILTVPYGDPHFGTALEAWLRYGKGRHPARLNFGNCLAYATAKVAGQPLLCTGKEFARTDLDLA